MNSVGSYFLSLLPTRTNHILSFLTKKLGFLQLLCRKRATGLQQWGSQCWADEMWHLVNTNKGLHWLSLGVFTENFHWQSFSTLQIDCFQAWHCVFPTDFPARKSTHKKAHKNVELSDSFYSYFISLFYLCKDIVQPASSLHEMRNYLSQSKSSWNTGMFSFFQLRVEV